MAIIRPSVSAIRQPKRAGSPSGLQVLLDQGERHGVNGRGHLAFVAVFA